MEEVPRPFLPKRFFVTSGKATSRVSPLNAFDAALVQAGLAQCNLVRATSIIPADAEEVKDGRELAAGSIVFCILSHREGSEGETIGAGIAWAFGSTPNGERYGIVAEAHGQSDEREMVERLRREIYAMAEVRNLNLERISTRVECLKVPEGQYGSAVVALVFLP